MRYGFYALFRPYYREKLNDDFSDKAAYLYACV